MTSRCKTWAPSSVAVEAWPLELLHLAAHQEQTERLIYHVAPLGLSDARCDDVQDLIQDVYQIRFVALLCASMTSHA